jgi:hypothetical protein
MSVFVPTGATVAVDPLDVLLVVPNGSTHTTLYLAQGQPVVVNALPPAVGAELDAAAGLSAPDTLFTSPVSASEWPAPLAIAGAQVKRVQPSGATQAGSMVLFALSGFSVTVPDIDLDAMVALINATSSGGGARATNAGSADGASLTIADQVNIASTSLQNIFWSYVPDPEGTEGTVTARIYGDATTTAPGAAEFSANGLAANGLPYPVDGSGVYATLQVQQGGAGAFAKMFGENDALYFSFVGVDANPIVFTGVFVYRTGGS